jgi:hypothetical protein
VTTHGAGHAFHDRDVEPPTLRAWFAKALAPRPEDRYQSAAEMRTALAAGL